MTQKAISRSPQKNEVRVAFVLWRGQSCCESLSFHSQSRGRTAVARQLLPVGCLFAKAGAGPGSDASTAQYPADLTVHHGEIAGSCPQRSSHQPLPSSPSHRPSLRGPKALWGRCEGEGGRGEPPFVEPERRSSHRRAIPARVAAVQTLEKAPTA